MTKLNNTDNIMYIYNMRTLTYNFSDELTDMKPKETAITLILEVRFWE